MKNLNRVFSKMTSADVKEVVLTENFWNEANNK